MKSSVQERRRRKEAKGDIPHSQFSVTGSKIPIHKSSSLTGGGACESMLTEDILCQGHNPWQVPPADSKAAVSGSAKKLLVSVSADPTTGKRAVGKGWTVAIAASNHLESVPPSSLHCANVGGRKAVYSRSQQRKEERCEERSVLPRHKQGARGPLKQGEGVMPWKKKGGKQKEAVAAPRQGKKPKPKEEFRTRYLCKKYFRRWGLKVFGRVLPSVARRHLEVCWKKKVLVAWQDECWLQRKEWKLSIRADCHNRYRLWIMVWKSWTVYVRSCREKKKRLAESQALSSNRILKRALLHWMKLFKRRREEKMRWLVSVQWHSDAVQRRCWLQWKQALILRQQDQAMATIALHHWAASLQRRVWKRWCANYKERLVFLGKMAAASHHSGMRAKQAVVLAWRQYVTMRRDKSQLKQVAVASRSSALLLTSYSKWKAAFVTSRQIAQFEGAVALRSKRATCRRFITHWKHFVALCRYKTHLRELSTHYRCQVLKWKGLRVFQCFLHQQRQARQDRLLATATHNRARLRQCWDRWLQRCEHNEEISLGGASRRARAHAAGKLARRVLEAWVRYTLHSRHKKSLKHRADAHFRQSFLPKCFEALKINVSIRTYICHLKEQSQTFRRETLLSMAFYKWWRESQLSQDVRMLERVALLHWEEKAKRRLLELWRSRCQEKLLHQHQEELAADHRTMVLRRRCFRQWRSRWQLRTSLALNYEQAREHKALKLQAGMWKVWREYIAKRRKRQSLKVLAEKHFRSVIFSKVLKSWQVYRERCRTKSQEQQRVMDHYHGRLQRHAFSRWREVISECRRGRQFYRIASNHHMRGTLLKCLGQWRQVAVQRRLKRERESCVLASASAHLLLCRARRLLLTWKGFAEEEVTGRLKEAKALNHYFRVLCRKAMTAWQDRCQLAARKQLLSQQSQVFSDSRILSVAYAQWRRQLMWQLQWNQKCVVSLWQWSHKLEQRVVAAWLRYTECRRRKAERYGAAMQRHRDWLLTAGVRRWMKVGMERRAQREEQALDVQAKNTRKTMRCVRRCARHWRELTRRHRPPTMRRGVSSASTLASQEPDVWNNLVKHLNLPASRSVHRPPPRRPADHLLLRELTTIGDSLPRLIPPPPSLSHMTGPPGGVGQGWEGRAGSLDVTSDETSESGALIGHTSSTELHRAPSASRRVLPPSHPWRDEHVSMHVHVPAPSHPRRDEHVSMHVHVPAELPPSHPLRDSHVQEEMVLMRQRMRQYLQLRIRRRSLLESLNGDGGIMKPEKENVERELKEVEVLIRQSEPVVQQVATRINQLLQLC